MKTIYHIQDDLEVLSKMIKDSKITLQYTNNDRSNSKYRRLIIDRIRTLKSQYLITKYKSINSMKL